MDKKPIKIKVEDDTKPKKRVLCKKHYEVQGIGNKLVVSAMKDLRDRKGITPSKIIGFISYGSPLRNDIIKKEVSFITLNKNFLIYKIY